MGGPPLLSLFSQASLFPDPGFSGLEDLHGLLKDLDLGLLAHVGGDPSCHWLVVAVAHEFAMARGAGNGAVHQRAGPDLGGSREQRTEQIHQHALRGVVATIQLGEAEARVDEVDDHRRVVAQAGHQLADEQHLQGLADVVSVALVECALVVQLRVQIRGVEFAHFRQVVDVRRHDLEVWQRIGELLPGLLQLGQQRHRKEQGVEDVDLDDLLEALGGLEAVDDDAGVFNHGVESWQRLRPLRERDGRLGAREIQGPDFNGVQPVGTVLDGSHDVFLGGFTFLDRAHG